MVWFLRVQIWFWKTPDSYIFNIKCTEAITIRLSGLQKIILKLSYASSPFKITFTTTDSLFWKWSFSHKNTQIFNLRWPGLIFFLKICMYPLWSFSLIVPHTGNTLFHSICLIFNRFIFYYAVHYIISPTIGSISTYIYSQKSTLVSGT